MKKGGKLDVEKPALMTEGEWQATRETLSMLNQTIPDEAWANLGEKLSFQTFTERESPVVLVTPEK